MTMLGVLGRPLLGAIFVAGGLDAWKAPEEKAEMAHAVTAKLEGKGPLPSDTTQLVRLNAAAQVVAGGLLAAGIKPRLSALALIASLVPTTLAGHRFWEKSEGERAAQRIQFLKNLAAAGGLLEVVGMPRRARS